MSENIELRATGDTVFTAEPGEKALRDIRSDRTTYWRDHGIMAVLGMFGAGVVLTLIGSPYAAIGALGAVLALAVRGAYLYSEQMKFQWVVTNMRLIGPGGRAIMLLELENVRRLFGDIQVITKSGDKYLIKHVKNPADAIADILSARDKRAKRRGGA
ncbi:hypothetical protein [Roseicitreum antarcticum]|uniref:PH domain-containing protein n=1 Tax=Roseicitreum antarcticum TaxID=564137 RepID=A0A1H2RJH0_9RHOB|nr:hypothetical protein [Roseicitreum antarcticum]SDW19571.1 hypothetical protein SAMN04488238_101338 [Roseicitreum antarcticum]